MKNTHHIFALYYPALHIPKQEKEIILNDADLVHRLTRVLRLTIGDHFFVFDRFINAQLIIKKIDRHTVICQMKEIKDNTKWQPSIIFLLPILKREALNAAVYSLVEAGVNEIQLIQTEKGQRKFGITKEMKRLERIIIAAAEQSKNFAFPQLKEPVSFMQALKSVHSMCYVGDPAGQSAIAYLCKQEIPQCTLIVGPEGDFSTKEKMALKKKEVIPLQLTPTILRAESAVFYLASLFRSAFLK